MLDRPIPSDKQDPVLDLPTEPSRQQLDYPYGDPPFGNLLCASNPLYGGPRRDLNLRWFAFIEWKWGRAVRISRAGRALKPTIADLERAAERAVRVGQ